MTKDELARMERALARSQVEIKSERRARKWLVYTVIVLAGFGAGYWVRLLTTPLLVIDFAPHHQQTERL